MSGRLEELTNDSGVIKEILREGVAADDPLENTPQKGDDVFVHYVGTLEDGTEFDSSRSRGEPFMFKLGEGRVIKGWDIGVASMKKGELAKFTITAPYGYGDAGSPPKIPGGATLVFEVELLSWKSKNDLTGDGGVKKLVTTEGDGWATPKGDDEVCVSVKGYIDEGDKQDVFVEEKEYWFTLSEGYLCPGVLRAVETMKKGEEARVKVSPEYGFGDAGREGVPPGSKVSFDIKLHSWNKVEHITPDKGVVKKILVPNDDWKHPNDGATVTVSYVGKLADGTVFDERPESNPLTFVTDEDQCPCEGLELAVMKMKKEEEALVTVKPAYAFGSQGSQQPRAQVPGGATIQYHVKLISFENAKESWDMETDEKIAAAQTVKDKGNAAYKAGKLARAVKLWEKAKQYIEFNDNFDTEAKDQSKKLTRSLELNLAAAYLKTGEPMKARSSASKVLDKDIGNIKALYRRAQSYIQTQDWVEASQDIKAGLSSEPENMDFKILAKKLKLEEAKTAKKEASLWANTFHKMHLEAKRESKAAVNEAQAEETTPQEDNANGSA